MEARCSCRVCLQYTSDSGRFAPYHRPVRRRAPYGILSPRVMLEPQAIACPGATAQLKGVRVLRDRMAITHFEAVEGGYLLALEASGDALDTAYHAIVWLDPWQRHWIQEERAWWIADDAITLLARRLPAVAEALASWHLRPPEPLVFLGEDGWPVRRRRIIHIPADVVAAYGTLGLAPGSPASAVRAARRALARREHPDAGGRHDAMVAINTATDIVLCWLSQRDTFGVS
jgi:hypothetical protein